MNDEFEVCGSAELSAEGCVRRARILAMAKEAGRARKAKHRARVGGAVVMACVVAVIAVMVQRGGEGGETRKLVVAPSVDRSAVGPSPTRREAVVKFIETDGTLVDQLRVKESGGWVVLSDEGLLEKLAQAGRPAGLAWIGDRAMVVYRER